MGSKDGQEEQLRCWHNLQWNTLVRCTVWAVSQTGENSREDERATRSPQLAWQQHKLPEWDQEQWQPSLHTAKPGSPAIHLAESHGLSKLSTHHSWPSFPDRPQWEHAATQVSAALTAVLASSSEHLCGRCTQVEGLLCLVQELWEEVSKLRSTQEW